MAGRGLSKQYQTEEFKKAIFDCAYAGMTQSQILRKLDLPRNFFRYANAKNMYLAGRDALAEKVRASIIEASTDSYLDRKLLVEKLGIFSDPFETAKLETPLDARNAIAGALQRYTEGLISEQALNAVTKASMVFIESYSQTVLADDIAELKKMLQEKKDEEPSIS